MPRFARVVKIEEKGSDVNLGAHLVPLNRKAGSL